jgi:cytochrome bd-type quinol oxidase subunit 2
MSDPFVKYDALVKELEREPHVGPERAAARPRRSARAWARVWAFRALLLAAALVLPFYILVGVSVMLYRYQSVPTWPALLAGVLLTFLILLLYASRVAKRLSGKHRVPAGLSKAMLALVAAYAVYALVYLSGLNVKNEDLRSEYRSLHPLLRVATSTFILVDGDLVITDMERQAADYERMRLPVYERSLHFVQEDGYAHAVDLRTIGRSEWRNFMMQVCFRAMGFRTLRHVGTADHLHVSLPLPD